MTFSLPKYFFDEIPMKNAWDNEDNGLLFQKLILGWEKTDHETYSKYHFIFNGSISCNPDFLNFQQKVFDIKPDYFIKTTRKGIVQAAICVWNSKYPANDAHTRNTTSSIHLPIATDELVLPIANDEKIVLPFKSKIISSINEKQILNSSSRINSGRKICIAKDISEFSCKTKQTRSREVRKFLSDGGVIKDLSTLDAAALMNIYDDLYFKRRGKHTQDITLNISFINEFRKNIFGSVLFYKEKPCALQIITKYETRDYIYFDYINIGYDTKLNKFCLGTILTWVNLNSASALCKEKGKIMRFSFGKPTLDYKMRWCHTQALSRSIII